MRATISLITVFVGILGVTNLAAAESRPSGAHVAISLGDGKTVESKHAPNAKTLKTTPPAKWFIDQSLPVKAQK